MNIPGKDTPNKGGRLNFVLRFGIYIYKLKFTLSDTLRYGLDVPRTRKIDFA